MKLISCPLPAPHLGTGITTIIFPKSLLLKLYKISYGTFCIKHNENHKNKDSGGCQLELAYKEASFKAL